MPNILKSGVKVLCPNLTLLYPAIHGCLSKHSMHKKRNFDSLEEWVGLEIRKVPKFLDVRFRVIHHLADWCENQDRALYVYFSDLKEKVMRGKYDASETEMIIMEHYLGNYLEVRLSQCFILEVDKPIIQLINFFESQQIHIHQLLYILKYNIIC